MKTIPGLAHVSEHSSTPEAIQPAMGLKISTQEIERKWLVQRMPDLTGLQGQEVVQGYIAVTPEGLEVRIRQKGDKYFQTIKSDGDVARQEVEIELRQEQFEVLWPSTAGRRVEKTRYELRMSNGLIELDVYRGDLAGLVVAEVEFPSVRDSEQYSAPDWFGKEVTDDKRYKNKNLALHGNPQYR